jgi:glyoxylase-like metal-dependent hydrolase (beta-lactamase superfamily II)
VDYTHNRIRGINVTHHHDDHDYSAGSCKDDHHVCTRQDHQEGDRGEPEVFQGLQQSLDNLVRQRIIDQEGNRGDSEVSSRVQRKEKRPEVTRDHYGRSGFVRGLWRGGVD